MPDDIDMLADRIASAVAKRLRQEPAIEQRYLSVEQAGRYAALSAESIRRMLASGVLTPLRPVRGRVLIDRRQLDGIILGATRRPTGGRGRYERQEPGV
jgi:excisionase family DNA binding protein